MSDLLKDEDIWGPAADSGTPVLSDADIWGPPAAQPKTPYSTAKGAGPRLPPAGVSDKGLPQYSADNPPYNDDAFVNDRASVNGVEYRRHSTTGTIYDPAGKPVADPLVLQAFGKDKPTKAAQRRIDATTPTTSVMDDAAMLGRGVADRAVTLLGGFLAAQSSTSGAPVDPLELKKWVPWLSDEDVAKAKAISDQTIATQRGLSQSVMQGTKQAQQDIDYQPLAPWESVKEPFMAGQWLETLKAIPGFAAEQFITSLPNMVAAGVAPQLAFPAETGRIATERAQNDQREFVTNKDMTIAAPVGAAITVGERIGLGGILNPAPGVRGVLQAGAKEGGTEFFQEGSEDVASTIDTKKGWNPAQSLEMGVAGLVGGAPAGAVASIPGAIAESRQQTTAPGKTDRERAEPRLMTDEEVFGTSSAPETVQNVQNVQSLPNDDAVLVASGYSPEQISDMNTGERAQAAQEAREQGIVPAATIAPEAPPVGAVPPAPPRAGTRSQKATIQTPEDLDAVRPTVNPEPTEAQAQAGNYQKGHVRLNGLEISIENARGSVRRGKDPDTGEAWESPALPADYGYVKRSTGKDGDHVDVYIGRNPASDRVFVVDQMDVKTGKFDEHKAVLAADTLDEAVALYTGSFDNPTYDRIGDVTEMSVDEFREWVKDPKATKRPAGNVSRGGPVVAESQQNQASIETVPEMPVSPQGQPDDIRGMVASALDEEFAPDQDTVDKVFNTYLASRKPISEEAFAKAAKIDLNEAGRAIQRAALAGRVQQGRNGKWRRPATYSKPINVLDFIASIGGISDPTGELRGMDLPKMGPFGPIVRKNGLHPDNIREQLLENGYLQDRGWGTEFQQETMANDVYELIAKHMGGQKVYSTLYGAQEQADEAEVIRRNEDRDPDLYLGGNHIEQRFGTEAWAGVQSFFVVSGTTEETWSYQEVSDAARFISEGMDPGGAFERAAYLQTQERFDPESEYPEVAAWMQARDKDAMEAVGNMPPFPDVEAVNAVEERAPEASAGVSPAGEEVARPEYEADAESDGGEVSGTGPVRGGEGQAAAEVNASVYPDNPSNLEQAIFDLPSNLIRQIGNQLGVRQGGKGKVGFVEAITANPRADVLKAYQAATQVAPTAEPGADNRPQLVLPGAEQDVGGAIRNAAKKPLKGKKPQKDMDVGMFGDGPQSPELFDAPQKKPEAASPDPTIPAGFELTTIKRLTAAEVKNTAWTAGQYRAIIRRNKPYGMYDGTADTRADAITSALYAAKALTREPASAPQKKPESALVDKNGIFKSMDDLRTYFNENLPKNYGVWQTTGSFEVQTAEGTTIKEYRGRPTLEDVKRFIANLKARIASGTLKPEEKPKAEKWTKIGTNRRGNPVWEDENGVRSYTESGIRMTEPVGIIPGGGISVGIDRSSDFEPVATKPAASVDEAFETVFDEEFAEKPQNVAPKPAAPTVKASAASAVKNTAAALDEASAALMNLFGGKKLSSGFTFDEDTYAAAKPHFRAALANLKAAGDDLVELARALIRHMKSIGMDKDGVEAMSPYLKQFMRDVQAGKEKIEAPSTEAPTPATETAPSDTLVQAFRDYLGAPDNSFASITEARKFAAERGFTAKPGTLEAKELDERLEQAIVLVARDIVKSSRTRGNETTYRRLVDLYARQPNLGVRTSESMADQAYSTPAPLAYIASRLAGVSGANSVLEPTAGNGMLLIEASPAKAHVNEINERRADALQAQGFRVSRKDAATDKLRHEGYRVQSVIANPPFGAVPDENGRSKIFTFDGWNTTQIDHVIALNSLKALSDDGRAVLIVGSVKEGSDKNRSDAYNSKQKREFYWRLYRDYNVTDHFTVAGDLYKRQGAGWPVDVIVIEGRSKSARGLPAAELPKVYDTWEELQEKLADGPGEVSQPPRGGNVAEDAGNELAAGSPTDSAPAAGGRPDAQQPADAGQAAIPDGSDQREPADAGEQQSAEPDGGQVSAPERDDGVRDSQPAAPPRERITKEAQASEAAQQPYRPMSALPTLDTKIPTNMADAVETSLQDLADRHGDLDKWIEKELGYKPGKIGKYLAAEQVDAVALALDNVQKGAAFIIGDQTGIGKGRVVASALRYAMRKGLTPIFVTEKPNLYGDIIRDMNDIGMPEMLGRDLRPFLTNSGMSVPLDDEAISWFDDAEKAKVEGGKAPERRGKFLRSASSSLHKKQMADLQRAGVGKDKAFDIIFTTYDQMNTVKGETTDRRRLIDGLADGAFIVLDESHNAGGTDAAGWQSANAPQNRSDFLKGVTSKSKAVMFSSATYAKRPGTMALYARTDMGKAVEKPEMLGDLIARGGVPMQQVVASMLAKAGQYIRRERSFDGVSYDVEPVPVDENAYEAVSTSLARIAEFDRELKKSEVWEEILEGLKGSGEAAAFDSATGQTSVTSTNFTSLMHNIVSQMLLAIKADSVASRTIEALKAGEKPIITVANTMGAFLKSYATENDIKRGDAVNVTFRDVLGRYLDRTLRLTVKSPEGEVRHQFIPLDALPGYLRQMHREAKSAVASIDTTNLPISPIDWMRHRLLKAGYRVGEITGRKEILDYSGTNQSTLAERLESEISPAGRGVNVKKFNSGDLDVMILNRAGSTGLSLHSSIKFKDQRRRRMIIAQAELNIDVHMQMLGRAHRTGQVIPPAFSQAYAEIPAEARPAAVLAKKMASLNANTTASRKSAFTADDGVDFLNEYGDEVAREFLRENLEISDALDISYVKGEEETARVLTGKLLLLPVAEQKRVLDEITTRYKLMIENLDALGENALEAKTMDLGAKTISRQEIKPSEGESPFEQAVTLEEVEVKSSGKALPIEEVIQRAANSLTGQDINITTPAATLQALEQIAGRTQHKHFDKWFRDFEQHKKDVIAAAKGEDTKQKRHQELNDHLFRFRDITEMLMPGQRIVVRAGENEAIVGIVMDVKRRDTKGGGNPLAFGAWSAEIAIPDNAQRIIVPLSSIALPADSVAEDARKVFITKPDWAQGFPQIVDRFAKAALEGKETRYIITGNILAGFDQARARGQIVNYTDDQGDVKPGILMPRQFNAQTFFNERAVRFKTAAQVVEFIGRVGDAEIESRDKLVTVRADGNGYEIELPAGRGTGGTYFLNPKVRTAARDQFAKVGSKMRHRAPDRAAAVRVLDAMMEAGALFQVTENQDVAEQIINGDAPRQAPLSSLGRQASARDEQSRRGPMVQTNPYRAAITVKQRRALDAAIQEAANRILGRSVGRVVTTLDMTVYGFDEREEGIYDPNTDIVYVALQGASDGRSLARHEMIHKLRNAGVFTRQEWNVLSRMAQTRWMDQYDIRQRYEEMYRERFDITPDQLEELLAEEAIAEAFADHWLNPSGQEDLITRIFERIRRFLEAVANAARGEGFRSAEGVLGDVEGGKVGARAPGSGQERDFLLYARQDARPRLTPPRNPAAGSFDAPHDERVRKALFDSTDTLLNRLKRGGKGFGVEFRRQMQDREVDLARTQKAITAASGPVPETQDAYLAASLYPGRVAQRDKDLIQDVIEPLVKEIADRGLTLEQVDDFNRARHAFERNIEIGQLYRPGQPFHDAMTDPTIVGGSGMSDNEAAAILDGFQTIGKYADLEAVGDKIIAMNRRSLTSLFTEGLIDQDTFDTLTKQYKFYVPLRGFEEATDNSHPDSPKTGSRYDVRGKEFQQAFGRTSKSDSPLAYSILQARQAIIRVEKNRVGKRFLRLAQANPNDAFWQINRADMKKVVDKTTGVVRNVYDRGATQAENVYAVKVGGKTYHITLHHDGLLRAMKGIGGENMHGAIIAFHKINRFLAAMNTSFDPEFIFRNFFRDLQQTGIVLSEERIPGLKRAVIGNVGKAVKGMNAMLRGDLSSQWAQYARDYADAGGKMGFMDRNDIESEKRNLDKLFSDTNPSKGRALGKAIWTHTIERLDRYNDAIENTLRLSTYVALRNAGVSRDKAAYAARELTVNFNRKGELGPMVNSLYLFFNASMQGIANMSTRLVRSRRLQMVAAGIVGAAFLQDMLNRMIAGDDDDDENRYDKIDAEVKARNGIIMMPKWFEEKYNVPYFKWPLPLGYNSFHVIGTQIGHAAAGAETPMGAAGNIVAAVADSFNPLGNGGTLSNFFAPTLLDPVVDINTNTDYFGENIVPRQFDETTPYAERYKPNVNPLAKGLTDALASATGGSPERAGSIDWSPEWVEHIWDFATGGVGRLFSRASSTASALTNDEDIDVQKVPFARIFAGQANKFGDRDTYFEIKDAVHVTEREYKARLAEGDKTAAERVKTKYGRELQMVKMVDEAEKRLAKLRKQRKAVIRAQGMGEATRKKSLDAISKKMDDIQLVVRRRWNQLEAQ